MIDLTGAQFADLVGLSEGEGTLRPDYSGRGMYGRTCLALVGNLSDYARLVVDVAHEVGVWNGGDDVEAWRNADRINSVLDELVTGVRVDSIGLQQVYYWPRLRVAKSTTPRDRGTST